jgi:hypothetical protein
MTMGVRSVPKYPFIHYLINNLILYPIIIIKNLINTAFEWRRIGGKRASGRNSPIACLAPTALRSTNKALCQSLAITINIRHTYGSCCRSIKIMLVPNHGCFEKRLFLGMAHSTRVNEPGYAPSLRSFPWSTTSEVDSVTVFTLISLRQCRLSLFILRPLRMQTRS